MCYAIYIYMCANVLCMLLHCVFRKKVFQFLLTCRGFPCTYHQATGIVVIVIVNYRLQQVLTTIKACIYIHVAHMYMCVYSTYFPMHVGRQPVLQFLHAGRLKMQQPPCLPTSFSAGKQVSK